MPKMGTLCVTSYRFNNDALGRIMVIATEGSHTRPYGGQWCQMSNIIRLEGDPHGLAGKLLDAESPLQEYIQDPIPRGAYNPTDNNSKIDIEVKIHAGSESAFLEIAKSIAQQK